MISAWTRWLYLRPCQYPTKFSDKESRVVMSTVKTQLRFLNLALYVLDWFVATCEWECEQNWLRAHVQADHRGCPHSSVWRLASCRINLFDGKNYILSLLVFPLNSGPKSSGQSRWREYLRCIWRKINVDVWAGTLTFLAFGGSFIFVF